MMQFSLAGIGFSILAYFLALIVIVFVCAVGEKARLSRKSTELLDFI